MRVLFRSVGWPVAIGSGRLQVDRRGRTAAVGCELGGDALVLIDRAHPGALDRRDMNEGVRPARFGRDEAVALVGVEEFYSSGGHGCILCPIESTGMCQSRHIVADRKSTRLNSSTYLTNRMPTAA